MHLLAIGSRSGLQHLVRMPLLSVRTDPEAAIGPGTAETHVFKPALARFVHHSARPASLTAKMQPMQSRAATCFKIRLLPHGGRITRTTAKRKRTARQPPP
jgi:hypothetical protein